MPYVEDVTSTQPTLIGVVEVAAALGVVLIMLGGMATHIRRGELAALVPNVILALMAAVVAWGRFGPCAVS